jgi:hypothetical protein
MLLLLQIHIDSSPDKADEPPDIHLHSHRRFCHIPGDAPEKLGKNK